MQGRQSKVGQERYRTYLKILNWECFIAVRIILVAVAIFLSEIAIFLSAVDIFLFAVAIFLFAVAIILFAISIILNGLGLRRPILCLSLNGAICFLFYTDYNWYHLRFLRVGVWLLLNLFKFKPFDLCIFGTSGTKN